MTVELDGQIQQLVGAMVQDGQIQQLVGTMVADGQTQVLIVESKIRKGYNSWKNQKLEKMLIWYLGMRVLALKVN